MDLTLRIKEDGARKGMCAFYQGKLIEGLSIQRLSTLFFRGIDFCIGNDFPTLEFLRKNIRSQGDQYGFCLDNKDVRETNIPRLCLNGECKARLQYQNCNLGRLYVRHGSSAKLFVSGTSVVTIDAFDDSHLDIIVAGNDSKVLVYLYGNATCTAAGQGVKITHKNKQTY